MCTRLQSCIDLKKASLKVIKPCRIVCYSNNRSLFVSRLLLQTLMPPSILLCELGAHGWVFTENVFLKISCSMWQIKLCILIERNDKSSNDYDLILQGMRKGFVIATTWGSISVEVVIATALWWSQQGLLENGTSKSIL